MRYSKTKAGILILTGIIMVLSACKHDRNHPGYAYMAEQDMYYSDPHEAYTENEVFNDSLTMRVPVEGTIPRGMIPYPYEPRNFQEQQLAGKELVNPFPVNNKILAKGKEQYQIYCMACHGEKGDGNGHLYTSGKYPAMPTSLIETYVTSKPDGEIYHVITLGSLSGLMGAHGAQITPENRWKIIHYVRTLAK
jgi:mono/diheme cytochrome c family protein